MFVVTTQDTAVSTNVLLYFEMVSSFQRGKEIIIKYFKMNVKWIKKIYQRLGRRPSGWEYHCINLKTWVWILGLHTKPGTATGACTQFWELRVWAQNRRKIGACWTVSLAKRQQASRVRKGDSSSGKHGSHRQKRTPNTLLWSLQRPIYFLLPLHTYA